MRSANIGNSQIMVIDGKAGDKFITYQITKDTARMVERRGNWTPPRLKMAWNVARKSLQSA